MGESVQVIPIDPEGRYVFILNAPLDMHPQEVQEITKYIREKVDEWWKGTDAYTIIATYGGLEVKFERVEK